MIYQICTSEENLRRTITNVNSEEISEITGSLKKNKTAGEDQITPKLIKEGGEHIVQGLKLLLNKCLSEGSIPSSYNIMQ